ncbi:hypothetical protein JL857_20785 [Vibrio parahaemolyticus]|uniref:BCTnown n=1 Tax=Vibrio parahaemolyticus TaxID=670 RepID=A0A9Q3YJN0_VIBPH|nr:hypothetical protein [Vibrio parahaemolyticus]MCC3807569.1 hypothetical protein [Vibrio parahaemolyticus]MCI9696458.1 hypothetical protein [Vibrio parahaemolyticus]MCI9711078.1 hypothetical protein [Vibrio parahaemolyticus]MCI9715958.1 hypothetical protein [Vibrio parahaemolyticus]
MKYLSDYTNDKQTQAFDEAGAFFAFSQKQFSEAKKEGIEYCSMGAGLICPVEKAKHLFDRLEQINKEGVAQDIAENGKQAIIRRELFNYECFYTGDICNCVEALEDYGYSYDDIYQVYSHICKTEDVY